MTLSRLGMLALAGVVLTSFDAEATVMLPLTVEDMSKDAACVVRAEVLDEHAAWDKDKQRIYTYTRLKIVESIHATKAVDTIITVRTLGGEVGNTGMKVAGTPKFTPGEKVVVFLAEDRYAAGSFRVIGMSQGKFRLEQEAGRWVAVPSLEGVAFAKRAESGVLRVDHDPPPNGRLALSELRRRVKAVFDVPMSEVPEVKAPNGPAATDLPAATP